MTTALSNFASASPHDCVRKWAEDEALAPDLAGFINPRRDPAVVSPASSTARSTASQGVLRSAAPTTDPSFKRDTPVDDLSPGARRLDDLIVGSSASPTSAASPRVPSSGVRAGDFHERAPATSTATRALEILRAMSTAAASNSSTGGSTSTTNSDSAYKLLDRVPHRPKWSSDHTLSIVVCRALYPVNEDMLRPILAPYGVQQLVVNRRVTKSNGSHYVKAIVELRSRDDAAEARVSLQGKCLFDGCCYLDVKFALPYELASMATSTGATSTTASTACVIHDGVSHIEMPAGDSFLPPTNSVVVPSTTFSLVYPCTETVAASFAPYVLHQCCSELCGHHPCTEASEANKSEMGLSSMQAAAVSATTKVSMMPNDMSLQTAHDFAIFGTDQASVSACGATLDANDTSANKVFLDTEHMFPTTPMSSELSTFQPLEFYDCRRGAFVQWSPPLGMCVNLPMDLLEQDIQLQYIGRKQWLIEEISVEVSSIKEGGVFGFLEKIIEEEKKLIKNATANHATCCSELEPINHLWTMMLNDLNEGFSLEHLWDPGGLILSSWYLQQLEAILSHKNGSSVDISEQESIAFANLQTALYSPWCMECVKSDIGKTQTCWLQLQPKPPWSHLDYSQFH